MKDHQPGRIVVELKRRVRRVVDDVSEDVERSAVVRLGADAGVDIHDAVLENPDAVEAGIPLDAAVGALQMQLEEAEMVLPGCLDHVARFAGTDDDRVSFTRKGDRLFFGAADRNEDRPPVPSFVQTNLVAGPEIAEGVTECNE